jgi:aspartyl-tRNA(Asn)/glutamyl-tRNA(Gln) amidotransferase subunit C
MSIDSPYAEGLMKLSREEVEHIARLARIELDDTEVKKFQHELSAIVEFVETLNKADTSGVAPMTGGTVETNVMRDDDTVETAREGDSSILVGQSPEKKDHWIRVREIFSRER